MVRWDTTLGDYKSEQLFSLQSSFLPTTVYLRGNHTSKKEAEHRKSTKTQQPPLCVKCNTQMQRIMYHQQRLFQPTQPIPVQCRAQHPPKFPACNSHHSTARLPSTHSFFGCTSRLAPPRTLSAPPQRSSRRAQPIPKAMINVELSPATYLGVVLIGSGITLLQIRNQKPLLSRDTDIIAACIAILAGGILIFQV